MRAFGRDLIRGGHYGQRSCEPHLKAEHMAAPTNAAYVKKALCQLGAVHTSAASLWPGRCSREEGIYGQRSCEPHLKAEHMAAPTNAAYVKKALANSEPSTHGRTDQIAAIALAKKARANSEPGHAWLQRPMLLT